MDTQASQPTVVVLHGLARTHRSMAGLRREIEQAGFPTWCASYPSRRMGVDDLARALAERLRAELPGRELVAVTHSMGGILVRLMAAALPWRGAVMLAPPNTGSRLAAMLRAHAPYRWFYGPAGQDVSSELVAARWPMPPSPFAIIAGTRGLSPGNPVSWLSHGVGAFPRGVANDGTVAVDEAVLPGAVAVGLVDASHTWIMDHPQARRWVLEFLRTGTFAAK